MTLSPIDQPPLFFVISLVALSLAAQGGVYIRRRRGRMGNDERDELNLVLTSALTLLALIIGFSFSMAVGRYDARKNDESVEANAIETEYLRAGMLGASDAARVRVLLRQYVDERIATYAAGNASGVLTHRAAGRAIQHEVWSTIEKAVSARRDSVGALVASGMNDVIDAQGYTAAAWANRIPVEGWILMFAIALCCCALLGYDTRLSIGGVRGHFVLPILISISFYLIADLDSTHAGLIRLTPDNLISAAQSMKT